MGRSWFNWRDREECWAEVNLLLEKLNYVEKVRLDCWQSRGEKLGFNIFARGIAFQELFKVLSILL